MLWLDAAGEVEAAQGERTVASFARTLGFLTERDALLTRDRDRKAEIRLFVVEAELGMMSFSEARKRRVRFGELPADQAERVGQLLVNLEVAAVLAEHGRSGKTVEVFLTMHEAGRLPSGRAAVDFWLNILYYLRGSGDERYSGMVKELHKAAEREPSLRPYTERFRAEVVRGRPPSRGASATMAGVEAAHGEGLLHDRHGHRVARRGHQSRRRVHHREGEV